MAIVNIAVAVASIALLGIAWNCLFYPAFFSPLSKVPAAHPLARYTSLWMLWKRFRSEENRTLYKAHQTFGDVVLLGPNELSVNCVDHGIRTIYAGGFEKHEWYANMFTNYDGVHNMFSTIGSRPHSSRKRMVSNVYSKSYLHSSPTSQAIGSKIVYERLLPQVAAAARLSAPTEVHMLWNSATMDFVTAYKFGLSNSTNFLGDEQTASWWLNHYLRRKKFIFWPGEMPRFSGFLAGVGIHLSPTWVNESNQELEEWTLTMCDKAAAAEKTASAASDAKHPEDVPVVYRQLCQALSKGGEKSSYVPLEGNEDHRLAVASELLDNLAAGHETSAVTLTYLFHELSKDLGLQRELRDELLTLTPKIDLDRMESGDWTLPTARQIDDLPLLQAILSETLRLHSAIPGPQPRKTPAGICRIGNFSNVPGGIRISASPHCLHRNPHVFVDPFLWRPRRWLDADPSHLAEMQRWFWAFGSGGRMCIGSNMANLQMKLIIAAVLSCFFVRCIDDTGIEQEDAYTAHPSSGKLLMQFARW